MKRMIITPAQFKMINEATMAFIYDGGKPNDFQTQYTDFTANNPQARNSVVQGVNTSDTANQPPTTDTGDSQQASQVIMPPEKSGGNLEESRYSKRQVELGRILEMRRTGKVYAKKQLNEMFMETQENADRLRRGIGGCRLHDIFDAVEEFFPEEIDGVKQAFMNGADLPEYICTIFRII